MANRPDNAGKTQRQKQAEQRPGDRYDDFVERGNFRQPRAVHIRLTLDNVHRRELRQRNKSAKRKRAQRVLHTVDRLFPERLAEPDTELLDVNPAPARRQKMTELMHDDEQIKKNEDLEKNEDGACDVEKHVKT